MVCNPLVSVIVPCYNKERFAGRTLSSLRSQIYANFEVVIVDDCSTFSFPFMAFDHRLSVIADTTAMSQPYEIEYSIRIDANTVKEAE